MKVLGYYLADGKGGLSGDAVCPEHLVGMTGDEPELGVIFSDTEGDTPTHCMRCDALIPHALTSDGYEYVYEALRSLCYLQEEAVMPGATKADKARVECLESWEAEYGYPDPPEVN